VAVAVLALLTRGLHLDGLADLADGLGSGRPAQAALEIMRKSDIGPMGVVTIVSALLIQVGSLAHAASVSLWHGAAALLAATVTGRLAIVWACRTGVPAARPDGLGALVAGTVRPAVALLLTLAPLAGACLAASLLPGLWTLPLAILAGLAAAALLQWHATRRLGGITGDVLGALCETATTAAVLVAAMGLS
jgi:adenosylcobinamide-GDP ribazoletransferase